MWQPVIRISAEADREVLVDLWARSVRATHHFLTEMHFHEIHSIVSGQYLKENNVWIAAGRDGQPLGFMGLRDSHIETLFIHPDWRGKGIGKDLIRFALQESENSLTVDVNEQNEAAVGFYIHMGFSCIGRDELDPDGRPYPVLHLAMQMEKSG